MLRISVRRLINDHIQIDFADNGAGIPEHKQTVIFEKFSRLSDHAKAGGAGLGLAICREIVVNLGGTIYLDRAELRFALICQGCIILFDNRRLF